MSGSRPPGRRSLSSQLRLAVEASPAGMLMMDEHGDIVLVNGAIETMFGYDRDELLGRRIEMLIPGRFHAAHEAHRGNFFSAPQSRPMGAGRDFCGLRKDGSEVRLEIGLNPLQTDEGWFALASVVDITERKRLDQVDTTERTRLGAADTSERARQIDESDKLLAATVELSIRDDLTGCLNRREFNRILEEECDRAVRHSRHLALLILDLDHFKRVNDRYGHPAGDQVLIEVAARLQGRVRKTDRVARYGGEEFAVILPETGALSAALLGEQLSDAIAEEPFAVSPLNETQALVGLTVSIGIAEIDSACSDTATLIGAADAALYRAKNAGRNCVVVFTDVSP